MGIIEESEDNGRPGIDPVVLFQIVLIQHIYGDSIAFQIHQPFEISVQDHSLPLVYNGRMGKEPVHRPHKGNQCFKIDCPVIERKAQRHDLTDPNLLDSVWIGINARLLLQRTDCYRKNLRRHNLEQSCRAVLLPVNTPDIGHPYVKPTTKNI